MAVYVVVPVVTIVVVFATIWAGARLVDVAERRVRRAHGPLPERRAYPLPQAEADEHPSITCPKCGMTSYHPEDIRQRYCGNCHGFHDELDLDDAAPSPS